MADGSFPPHTELLYYQDTALLRSSAAFLSTVVVRSNSFYAVQIERKRERERERIVMPYALGMCSPSFQTCDASRRVTVSLCCWIGPFSIPKAEASLQTMVGLRIQRSASSFESQMPA
jgi:hypothetical protein